MLQQHVHEAAARTYKLQVISTDESGTMCLWLRYTEQAIADLNTATAVPDDTSWCLCNTGTAARTSDLQVISGDESGTVCLWHIHTGAREGHFKRAHGDGRLTAMALDAQERRLLTGKAWCSCQIQTW